MSYISRAEIAGIEERYGKPVELRVEFGMGHDEFEFVKATQKQGRAHDITMFIIKDDRLLFIAKHAYPDGLFRAPSGAARPGEGIVEGAKREAFEETGVEIELEKYLARINVRFFDKQLADKYINWVSYVFQARYISGMIKPRDTDEIREAAFVKPSDIPEFNRIMRRSDIGGFHYRAFLTENILGLLDFNSGSSKPFKSEGTGRR